MVKYTNNILAQLFPLEKLPSSANQRSLSNCNTEREKFANLRQLYTCRLPGQPLGAAVETPFPKDSLLLSRCFNLPPPPDRTALRKAITDNHFKPICC